MKVGYYSLQNCFDRRAWSGIIFSMYDSLRRQGIEFVNFGDHCRPPENGLFGKITSKYRQQMDKLREPEDKLKQYAAKTHKDIKTSDCDIIFAPVASSELHFLFEHGPVDVPVVYASDVTFRDLYRLYKPQLTAEQIEVKNRYEMSALSKSDRVVYPTAWAVGSATEDYAIRPDKVSVIPYGANITAPPDPSLITPKLQSQRCRLLFIGVDWERKGGDIVVEAFKLLEDQGFDVELYILGSNPQLDIASPNLHVIPFLNKNLEQDRARFNDILLNAHFLVFPTKADTFGIVNCEANAYGIPVIASDAGGVPSVVKDGINGHVLPLSASAEDYAKTIAQYLTPQGLNRTAYEPLMLSSRREYDSCLNWDAWGTTMAEILRGMVA